MLKKLLFSLFASLFLLSALTLVPKIYAQVISGTASNYFSILDIVLDSGGGSRESGTGADRVILKNTSIGQPTAGAYVVNNQLVVGGGHAYKADYCYQQGCPNLVGLEKLVVTADTNSGATNDTGYLYNKYLSGLRATDDPNTTPEDSGNQFYNNLLVKPYIFGNAANIELSGALFTRKDYRPSSLIPPQDQFSTLLAYLTDAQGFLVIYANKNVIQPEGPKVGSESGCATYNFCAQRYYAYGGDGKWQEINTQKSANIKTNGKTSMSITVHNSSNPPKIPAFSVALYKPLVETPTGLGTDTPGLKEWETFGFVTSTEDLAGEISRANPTNSAGVTTGAFYAAGIASTFYLFAL